MRGYCERCKEYRSDNHTDGWKIVWENGEARCERCGSVVDLWLYQEKRNNHRDEDIHDEHDNDEENGNEEQDNDYEPQPAEY